LSARPCPVCGSLNPMTAAYCGACGKRMPVEPPPILLNRVTGLRFQIDYVDPPPRRDARWVGLVLGIALAVVGGLFLLVDSIVTGALSTTNCASGGMNNPCGGPLFEYLFLLPGLAMLMIGVAIVVVALLATVRNAPGL
jgi:hypothetical protein